MRRYTLLIDADDTLWENNVFFENLIEDFITLVEPCGFTRAYIREIVNEKDTVTYTGLVAKHKIVKAHGWMIGNSPRSDINPALRVGLNAVYIPHQHTWHMEHEPVTAGSGKLVILPGFRELRSHF